MSDDPRFHNTLAHNCEASSTSMVFRSFVTECPVCVDDAKRREAGLDVQPEPIKTENQSSHDIAIEEMERRKQFGYAKYQSLLTAGNGRNSVQDAVDETADLFVYLITERTEREALRAAYEGIDYADQDRALSELSEAVAKYLGHK